MAEARRRGIDPAQHERELHEAAARKRANSFAAVFEDFVKEKLVGERQGRGVERDMRKEFVSARGKRPIADITDQDVLSVIRAVKQRGAPLSPQIARLRPPLFRLGDRAACLWDQGQPMCRIEACPHCW